MICITALMDNLSGREELTAEHGLSMLVEYGSQRVLFDCGQGPGFLSNARKLEINLADVDAVALSHSHYDHAKGYRHLAEAGLAGSVLYTGEGFFEPKHSLQDGFWSDRSCGFDRAFLEEHHISHRQIHHTEQIFPGMWILTGFPRNSDFETIPEKFHRKTDEGFQKDDFHDEICLALEAKDGLAVVVGCAHPGIVNMVTEITSRLGKPVWAVFGGTHLSEAQPRRLEQTLDALKEAGVEILGFGHCSGDTVEALVEEDSRFLGCHLGCGDRIFLEMPEKEKMIHF